MVFIQSIDFNGGISIEVCILLVDPEYFLEVGLVGLIDEFLRHRLPFLQLPLDALANHYVQAKPRREQDSRPTIPEEHSGELEAIEEESELEEWFEHGEGLVLVHHHHWVDRVPVFQRVLYKPLPVIYPASNLVGSGQGGLLEAARQQSDVLSLPHQLLQVLVVDCLHSPQFENRPRHWEIEDKSAAQPDYVSERALLDRIHEHEKADSEDAVRMYSEDASILLGDDLLIDDFEVVKVLEREEEFVDEVDVELAATQRQLDYDQCQQREAEVQIESKDSVSKDEDGHVECELRSREEQK